MESWNLGIILVFSWENISQLHFSREICPVVKTVDKISCMTENISLNAVMTGNIE